MIVEVGVCKIKEITAYRYRNYIDENENKSASSDVFDYCVKIARRQKNKENDIRRGIKIETAVKINKEFEKSIERCGNRGGKRKILKGKRGGKALIIGRRNVCKRHDETLDRIIDRERRDPAYYVFKRLF